MTFDFYKYRVEDVKPCPFCGKDPNFYGHGWIDIRCDTCGIGMENQNGSRDSESDCSRLKKKWNTRHTALTPAKGEPMPQTREYWEAGALRDQELILEMKAEIGTLTSQLNNCRQKLSSSRAK